MEDIRRKLNDQNLSLSMAFAGSKDNKTISWSQFVTALDKLQVYMNLSQERELQDLLDAAGPGASIDLAHFQALLGFEENTHNTVHSSYAKRYADTPAPKAGHARRREAIREIMRMLISRGVTVARLRLEFRVASGNLTIMPQRDFV